MKRLLYAITLSAFISLSGFAQFTLTPTSVQHNPAATETDSHADITIKNTTTSTKTYKWERTVISISPDCQTQMCDINSCYLPGTSTKNFDLAGGANGTLSLHFLNPTGLIGCADVVQVDSVGCGEMRR